MNAAEKKARRAGNAAREGTVFPKKTWRKDDAPKVGPLRNHPKPRPKSETSHEMPSLAKEGMRGVDPRSNMSDVVASNAATRKSPGATDVIPVVVRVNQRSIAYLAMGIMLSALKRGSGSSQTFAQFPYYQWRYLIDVFSTCMKSGTMLLTAAPHWLWEILYAIKPKEGSFKTGWVSYTWEILDDGLGFDQTFSLGTGEDFYTLYWGTGGSNVIVNGFPALGPVGAPYTPEGGLAAISFLWNYVLAPGEKIVGDPGPQGVVTGNDTSAFAVVYPELGESYFSEGAVRTTLYSERHIDSPALCQFAKYQDTGSPWWRGWHTSRVGAGSPSCIGPLWMEFAKPIQGRNKNTPIYKFYNFDEFFEQLSLIMCYASEKLLAAGQTPVACPLTGQQVAILLRQSLLQITNNEYAQDLRYSGASYVNMLPFVVGPNGTLAGNNMQMQVPTFIGENAKALTKLSTRTSKRFPGSVTWYPVLARPPSKPLDYGYAYGSGIPLYSSNVEIPINLIDVSAQVGQNTYYLDLTRQEISALLEVWNSWIANYTSVLSPLVTLTAESGLRAINCNTFSNIVETLEGPPIQVNSANNTLTKQKSKTDLKIVGSVGMSARVTETVTANSYFKFVGDRKITSLAGFNRDLDQIIDNLILPVNYSENTLNDASTQGYQAFMIEPAFKTRSSLGGIGGAGAGGLPPSYDRHIRAAQYDVKAFATTDQQNEVIQSFVELSKQGRGGFLTSALAGLANAFLPGSGAVVGSILGG